MLVISRVALPELVTVTVSGALVIPTLVFTNDRLAGFRVTAGANTPVPVRGAD
jgi:hypothetical protein